MSVYFFIKIIHIMSAAILFGTGLGIAFFMLGSCTTGDLREKFFATRLTVVADYLFTAPAAILQPLTGFWLVQEGGYDWTQRWLTATFIIYIVAACCWLPVVWIQIQLKQMVAHALKSGAPLPVRYHLLFRVWFILGWPAFIGLMIVFALMVVKPA